MTDRRHPGRTPHLPGCSRSGIPRWFGFHEVFHTLVIAAFTVHYIGVSILVYSLR